MVRNVLALALFAAACGGSSSRDDDAVRSSQALAASAGDTVVVYKSPTCGCCADWVDHMEENGFAVVTHDMDNLEPIKRELGVPPGKIACHTATVRGYTIEGHVPADLVRRMLDENARFRGLAVPGMPIGSPGMEGLVKQSYDVLSFDEEGRTEVYASR